MKKLIVTLVVLVSFSLTYANPIDPPTDKDKKAEKSVVQEQTTVFGFPPKVTTNRGGSEIECGKDHTKKCFVKSTYPDPASIRVDVAPSLDSEIDYPTTFYADKFVREVPNREGGTFYLFTNVRETLE